MKAKNLEQELAEEKRLRGEIEEMLRIVAENYEDQQLECMYVRNNYEVKQLS